MESERVEGPKEVSAELLEPKSYVVLFKGCLQDGDPEWTILVSSSHFPGILNQGVSKGVSYLEWNY